VDTAVEQESSKIQHYNSITTKSDFNDSEAEITPQQQESITPDTVIDTTTSDNNDEQPTELDKASDSNTIPLSRTPNKSTKYHAILPGGLREQNHLSIGSTRNILKGIFGMSATGGRKGLILTGHDHEGCDVVHYPQFPSRDANIPTDENSEGGEAQEVEQGEEEWTVTRTTSFFSSSSSSLSSPFIREITLRSMMGSYNGNAGLLSLWYDYDQGQWEYGFQTCALGVQHWWWAVHVLDLVVIIVAIIGIFARFVEGNRRVTTVSKGVRNSNGSRKDTVDVRGGMGSGLANEKAVQ